MEKVKTIYRTYLYMHLLYFQIVPKRYLLNDILRLILIYSTISLPRNVENIFVYKLMMLKIESWYYIKEEEVEM